MHSDLESYKYGLLQVVGPRRIDLENDKHYSCLIGVGGPRGGDLESHKCGLLLFR